MSANIGNCIKIRHIVKLRQLILRWRNKATSAASRMTGKIPSGVPAGHVAISVGSSCRRYVVPAKHLNHPIFKELLVDAEEEYGFTSEGPLAIPCEESVFEGILRFLSRSQSRSPSKFGNLEEFHRYNCHVDLRKKSLLDSLPLLQKPIW